MSKQLEGEATTAYEKRVKETEAIKVYDKDGIIVKKLLSYEASVLYGRKTKWCTSSVHTARDWVSHTAQNICFYAIINKNLHLDDLLYKVLAEVDESGEIRWWDAQCNQIDKPHFIE